MVNLRRQKPKLRQAKSQLRKNKVDSKELRTKHLMQRASVMNIEDKLTSYSTIINIQTIKQVIIMWNKINYLTSDNKSASLQTIDIPVDENINLNYIKHIPNLQLKTINDLEIDH